MKTSKKRKMKGGDGEKSILILCHPQTEIKNHWCSDTIRHFLVKYDLIRDNSDPLAMRIDDKYSIETVDRENGGTMICDDVFGKDFTNAFEGAYDYVFELDCVSQSSYENEKLYVSNAIAASNLIKSGGGKLIVKYYFNYEIAAVVKSIPDMSFDDRLSIYNDEITRAIATTREHIEGAISNEFSVTYEIWGQSEAVIENARRYKSKEMEGRYSGAIIIERN